MTGSPREGLFRKAGRRRPSAAAGGPARAGARGASVPAFCPPLGPSLPPGPGRGRGKVGSGLSPSRALELFKHQLLPGPRRSPGGHAPDVSLPTAVPMAPEDEGVFHTLCWSLMLAPLLPEASLP